MIINKRIFEIFIVCSISGFTMLLSGSILDTWKNNSILTSDDSLWILITPLIGLKGNIEMTLASRLSTLIKLGYRYFWRASIENLILVQIQGITVGFIAGLIGSGFHLFSCHVVPEECLNQCLRLIFITTITASITCFFLGLITVFVVRYSRTINVDPDNISSPLAAALGDSVTLIVIYRVANIYNYLDRTYTLYCLGILIIILPILYRFLKNTETVCHLYGGWSTIITALCLSSGAGYLLKYFVYSIKYLSKFQPLVNGIGGNIAAIQCSHLSSNLHSMKKNEKITREYVDKESNRLIKVLIFVGLSVHIMLVSCIRGFSFMKFEEYWKFIGLYITAVLSQIIILLWSSRKLVLSMWDRGIDPDNVCIPLATGFGDLLGTICLCGFMYIL